MDTPNSVEEQNESLFFLLENSALCIVESKSVPLLTKKSLCIGNNAVFFSESNCHWCSWNFLLAWLERYCLFCYCVVAIQTFKL